MAAPSNRRWPAWLLALLAGAVWPLGFAPFGLWLFPFLGLAALAVLTRRVGPFTGFGLGYLFGLASYVPGLYWLAHTLHLHGEIPWPASVGLMLLLTAYLAFYPALAVLTARFVGRTERAHFLVFPAAWLVWEYLRGAVVLTGFPWLALGYSQTDGPFAGYAPVLGVYGMSLAIALAASSVAFLLVVRERTGQVVALLLAGFLFAFGWFLDGVRFSSSADREISVQLLQGGAPRGRKWDPSMVDKAIDIYNGGLLAAPKGVELVVMPETALPMTDTQARPLLDSWSEVVRLREMVLITGIYEKLDGRYYNSAFLFDGHGEGRYRKFHLVPFGEYVPMSWLLGGYIEKLVHGESGFSPGFGPSALASRAGVVGLSICYELAFPSDIRRGVAEGAQYLVNISNDHWFGDTIAPHQHLQMARMRTLEFERAMVRATESGITAFVDDQGQVTATLPQFVGGELTGKVALRDGLTPYARFGDWPGLVMAGGLVVLAFALGRRRERRIFS